MLETIELGTADKHEKILNPGTNDNSGYACKTDYVKIKACGVGITSNCAADNNANGENAYYLCAKKIAECMTYKVEATINDRFGDSVTAKP